MTEKNAEYWRNRFWKLEELQHKKVVKYDKQLERAYTRTLDAIEKDLLKWYNRFAENNSITLQEARKRLNAGELREFKFTVDEYIKYAKENAINGQWIKQLENASARVHISRLESLFIQFSNHANILYDGQLQGLSELLEDSYLEQYNRVAYIVQTGTNVAFPLAAINEGAIQTIIAKPWASDGINFSERIYRDRTQLVSILQTELIQAIQLGEGVDVTARRLKDRLGVSYRNAVRLVQTEETAILSRANGYALKELSVDRYQYVATLDSRTSDICQTFDLQIFDINQYEAGVTAPPLHVNCRSTTAPYFEDVDYGERAARDRDGRTVYLPGNTSYAEWKEKYGV